MTTRLTEEQVMIQDMAKRFAADRLAPHTAEWDEQKHFPIDVIKDTAELGFAGPLARGLFCLSRSVGVIAHGWEQMQQGGRNKGPMPPAYLPEYEPQGDNE